MKATTLLARAAAGVVLVEAGILAVLLLVLAFIEDEDTHQRIFEADDLPVLLAPFVIVALGWLWAAVALWRLRLFGEGVGTGRTVLNVITVLGVFAFNAIVLVSVVLAVAGSDTDTFDAGSIAGSGLVVLGCVAAVLRSRTPAAP